jgi:cell division septation protein DedD
MSLKDNPLGETDALAETFYRPGPRPTARKADKPKPQHYKIVCISLYNEDIARLEEMVAELKRRGHTKANKSELIRFALAQVDLDKFNKGY